MDNLSNDYPAYTKQKTPFPRKLIFLILLFILLGAAGFAGIKYLSSEKKTEEITSPSVSPTVTEAPTETPTPVASSSGTPSPSTKASPTGKVTPTTTASNRANITVSILNGSGVDGAARKVSTVLKDAGYQIGTVGNADSNDYTNVTIQVKKSKATILSLLKQDLASYTVSSSSATLLDSGSADAVVIVGK